MNPMRYTNLLVFLVSAITLVACAKAGKEVAEEVGLIPRTCGADGARVQATVGGSSFCADGQIVAITDGTSANVSGVGLLGNTLAIQIDTLAVGTFPISEAENAMLFMATGTPYVGIAGQPGTLTITAFNAETRQIKASFETVLRNEMDGSEKAVAGTLDVTCTLTE